MNLCLDCGNTRLKWGLHGQGQWQATGALLCADIAQWPLQLPRLDGVERIVACNVAGRKTHTALEAYARVLRVPLVWVRPQREQAGVRSAYCPAEQLGADRWAALIGSRAIHSGSSLVVNCGTAVTIDRLDATGLFRGGLILPGLALMRQALVQRTARLVGMGGTVQDDPCNTADAMATGTLQAVVGAMGREFMKMAHEPKALCLLSGGDAQRIGPYLDIPYQQIDHLVLEGLAILASLSD
jgi:type III pantothenate kinase